MSRILLTLAGAALVAGSVLHQPVAAQDSPAQADFPPLTAHDARLCLMFFAAAGSRMEDRESAAATTLHSLIPYFAGFVEGASGQSVSEGDNLADVMEIQADLEAVSQRCSAHAESFFQRLSALGGEMRRQGRNAAPQSSTGQDD